MPDAALVEQPDDRLGRVRRDRDGHRHRGDEMDGARITYRSTREVVVQHERRLVRSRRALEESTEHTDDDVAARERGKHVAHSRRAFG